MLIRTKFTAGLASILVVAGGAVPASAKPTSYDRTSALEARRVDRVRARLDWTPCFDIAECATATVPLDYDQPDGATTQLAVLRVKARDQAHKIGSLFVNPGGPGGSATSMALAAGSALDGEVRDRFDVVGVDPRGIAMSQNVRCWKSTAEQEAALRGAEVAFPVGPAEERAYLGAVARLGRACSTTGRPLSGSMSTAEVARDMDVIRRAVGDPALTYLGFSYGTALGQYYANLFPDRTRAIVVDGVIDPEAWTGVRTGRYQVLDERMNSAGGAERALGEILRRCDAAGEDYCAFAAGDPRRNWKAITDRLRREPVVFDGPGGPVTITYAMFLATAVGMMYDTEAGALVTGFAAEVRALQRDPSDAAAGKALLSRVKARSDDPADYDNGPEAGTSVFCTDGIVPADPRTWVGAAARAERRSPNAGRYWSWVSAPCARDTWTVHDEDSYLGPFTKRTRAPLFYLGSFWDPATNYDASVSASRRQPGARLLSANNWGHTGYLTSPCTTTTVDEYLLRGTLPARGATCTDAKQPFTEPLSEVAAKRAPAPKRLPVATPRPKSILG
ncbi:alpha/beta fold hydrolase [Actinoplanes sp. NPDC049265]|uniref:alpha/beta fold hydrolase n=1 Tax=Actinoplanes sp. NPDC049265 TaxID=3363902 RepID=UPI0037191530